MTQLPPKVTACDTRRSVLGTTGDLVDDRQSAYQRLDTCAAKVETVRQWRQQNGGS